MMMAMPRLSKSDWISAALDAIARGGLTAVAVEPLAASLGVTKGSFYAHFSNRDELVQSALAAWEESHGSGGLSELDAISDPRARLAEVLKIATRFSQSGSPSVHMSLMGELHDPRVRAAVSRVTAARLERLAAMYMELGFTKARAAHHARLFYAAYLGLLQMAREAPEGRMTESEMRRFVAEARRTLLSEP
jgi:AcrR family transcriptional regulator